MSLDFRMEAELEKEFETAKRKFREAGLIFPEEVQERYVSLFHTRMCVEQRLAFVDYLRLLGSLGEMTARLGRTERSWGVEDTKFVFCLFCHMFCSERFFELFYVGVINKFRIGETMRLVFDILDLFFWANFEGSSKKFWTEVLGKAGGARLMR